MKGFLFSLFSSKLNRTTLIILSVFLFIVCFALFIKNIENKAYDLGVADTEAKYADIEGAEQQKTIIQQRTVKQIIYKKTDADIAAILNYWMQPDPETPTTE